MPESLSKSGESRSSLVGLLAFQGAWEAHVRVFHHLDIPTREIKRREDLDECTHLVIPGGESTTFLKLLEFRDLTASLRADIESGKPVLATCAGLILLSSGVRKPEQDSLGLLDIMIERNAYGRQVDSFETELEIPALGDEPFHGVFIRAPRILTTGNGVEVLATLDGYPVLVRQGDIIGATFHPELSGDTRLHDLFLSTGP